MSWGSRRVCLTKLATEPALSFSKLQIEESMGRVAASNTKGGFQLGMRVRCSGFISKVSPPLLCWALVTLVALDCSRGVSSWISLSSVEPLPPLLSFFRVLSARSVWIGGGGIGVGGLGTTTTSGVASLAWDSNKESKSGNFFSIIIASGISLAPWS